MISSVKRFCSLVARSRLLRGPALRAVRSRWLRSAGPAAGDVQGFARWLLATRCLTGYQVRRLLHGHTDCFFLGRYKILRRLGQGPLARVYKALGPEGHPVALKVLPPSRAREPRLRACFERQAWAACRLLHPNVVRALRAGNANGVRFIVLEHLAGETLADVLRRRGRLPPGEAVRLAYQALVGLQHVHQSGLVHGALEPANLMLVPDPWPSLSPFAPRGRPRRRGASAGEPDTTLGSTVKLLDAGLGPDFFEAVSEVAAESLRKTGAAVLPVSADYLAPERACDPRHSDIRADIYALGCVLYHCLTGQPPFPDVSPVAQMIRHATEAPRPLRDFDPALPPGLQRVMDRLLAKGPADRYPTPESAARALHELLPPDRVGPRGVPGGPRKHAGSLARGGVS
jgi:eukaryotic-like serine/threonine-protein kinase